MEIRIASWQVSVQANDPSELAEILRFAEDHYAEVEKTSMDPADAAAIPMPPLVNVLYKQADDPDDIAASPGALH